MSLKCDTAAGVLAAGSVTCYWHHCHINWREEEGGGGRISRHTAPAREPGTPLLLLPPPTWPPEIRRDPGDRAGRIKYWLSGRKQVRSSSSLFLDVLIFVLGCVTNLWCLQHLEPELPETPEIILNDEVLMNIIIRGVHHTFSTFDNFILCLLHNWAQAASTGAVFIGEVVGSIPVHDGDGCCELQGPRGSERPALSWARGCRIVLDVNKEGHPSIIYGRSLVSHPGAGSWTRKCDDVM